MSNRKISISAVSGGSLVKFKPIFSSDSKCLFSCSESSIRVFSTESGECIRNLTGHTNTVTGIIVNPNNKLQVLSCSLDQTLIQWDYSDGVLLKVYQFHHPLYHIYHLNHNDQLTLVLKRKISREEYDLVECALPTKTGSLPQIKPLLSSVERGPTTLAVGCQGKVIAVIKKKELTVRNQKKTISHKLEGSERTEFTCVACHPTDVCVVTGCKNGKIYYWYNVFDKKRIVKTFYHWHALPVLDLCFTLEGSFLLSGGHECVLVKWQYNSHQKDFLPRLGAPINHVACSPDNTYYATCHTDNVIQLITNKFDLKQVYQGLTCGHLATQKMFPVPAGLHYDPRSKALVTNGKIGHLQFYSVASDKHLYNLDIVGQNYISPENVDKPLTVTEIVAADFSQHGDWLATVEIWNDGVMSPDMKLKFWKFKDKTQKYTLNTTVEMPHNSPVTCIKIRPETGEEGDLPMAVTTGLDGYFKIWSVVDDTNIYRTNHKWTCQYSGYYRYLSAYKAAYSDDGSLLAVGFDSVVTIWQPETNVLLQTLASHKDEEDVSLIEFGRKNCSYFLVVCSTKKLTVWNLSTCTVDWSIGLGPVSLVTDPLSDVMAVITQDRDVIFFQPSSSDILYRQNSISSSNVVAAILIPPKTTEKQNTILPTTSKLYFFNTDQQLICLSEVDTSLSSNVHKLVIPENLPQSTLSLLLSKEKNKQGAVDTISAKKDVKSWKGFLDTPPQAQPAVTSLCKQFIQSMLIRSGTESANVEGEEDEEDLIEDNEMEIDEDSDVSDSVSDKQNSNQTNTSSKPVQNVKPQQKQSITQVTKPSTPIESDLNSHDMDWYYHKI